MEYKSALEFANQVMKERTSSFSLRHAAGIIQALVAEVTALNATLAIYKEGDRKAADKIAELQREIDWILEKRTCLGCYPMEDA